MKFNLSKKLYKDYKKSVYKSLNPDNLIHYSRFIRNKIMFRIMKVYIFITLKIIKYNVLFIIIGNVFIQIMFKGTFIWAEEVTLIKEGHPIVSSSNESLEKGVLGGNTISGGTWVKIDDNSWVQTKNENNRSNVGLIYATASNLSNSSNTIKTFDDERDDFSNTPFDSYNTSQSDNSLVLKPIQELNNDNDIVNSAFNNIEERDYKTLRFQHVTYEEIAREVIFLRNHTCLELFSTKFYKGPWETFIQADFYSVKDTPPVELPKEVTGSKLNKIPLHELYAILQKQEKGQLSEAELEAFLSKKYSIPNTLNVVSEEVANNIHLMPQWEPTVQDSIPNNSFFNNEEEIEDFLAKKHYLIVQDLNEVRNPSSETLRILSLKHLTENKELWVSRNSEEFKGAFNVGTRMANALHHFRQSSPNISIEELEISKHIECSIITLNILEEMKRDPEVLYPINEEIKKRVYNNTFSKL